MRYLATTTHQHRPCKSTLRQVRLAWKTGCSRPPGNTPTYTRPRRISRRHMNCQRSSTILVTSRPTLLSRPLSHLTCGCTTPPSGYPQHPSYTTCDLVHANTTHTCGTRNTAHTSRKKKQQHWTSTLTTMIDKHFSRDTVKPWASVQTSRTSNHLRAQAASPHQHRKHPRAAFATATRSSLYPECALRTWSLIIVTR